MNFPLDRSNFVPFIDGIRAIAIAGVVLNHFYPHALPSGYLGVDIFFVISGFVITRSLLTADSGGLRGFLVQFYAKRIKRLFPALLVCICTTSIVICLIDPEPRDYLRTGIAAVFGLSNIYLYAESINYWSESASLNPFTHTWSLGVEEQYYLLFPWLIWLLRRQTNASTSGLVWCILALSVASFLACLAIRGKHTSAVHYLVPFRFWELGIGCLICLGAEKLVGLSRHWAYRISPNILLLLLIAALFVPHEWMLTARLAALILTSLLVVRLCHHDAVVTPLTHPAVLRLGVLSYSIYLWHWPVLVVSKALAPPQWWLVPLQLCLTAVLAWPSYAHVERPLRYARWTPAGIKPILLSIGAMTSVLALSALSATHLPARLYLGVSSAGTALTAADLQKDVRCPESSGNVTRVPQKLLSVGNSHATHIAPMLRAIAKKCGLEVLIDAEHFLSLPSGIGFQPLQFSKILASLDVGDILILSGRNRYLYERPYINATGDAWVDHSAEKKAKGYSFDVWTKELDEIIRLAADKGIQVLFFLPNVEFDQQVIPYAKKCSKEWFRFSPAGCNPTVSRSYLDQRFPAGFYKALSTRAQANKNFFVFDPLPIYCPGEDDCARIVRDVVAFVDTNHLTPAGAQLMLPEFNAFLMEHGLLR
ncbi:MAG: acyltransferase family protein [Gammaproteobacteria bacterium]